PNLSFSWVSTCASSALRSSALDGMQPTFRQPPPQYCFSLTATDLPSWAARMAAMYPPGPAPRTTTSYCAVTVPTLLPQADPWQRDGCAIGHTAGCPPTTGSTAELTGAGQAHRIGTVGCEGSLRLTGPLQSSTTSSPDLPFVAGRNR